MVKLKSDGVGAPRAAWRRGEDRKVQPAREGLTFDDVLLVPKFSAVGSRSEENTQTRFSRGIGLATPIVSSNMDTVTEAGMAIAMAKLGGIGVIHRFLTIDEQVGEVRKVKRYEGILIEDPVTLGKDSTIRDAWEKINRHGIGGIIIVDKSRKVLGIVTKRDIVFEEDQGRKLESVMTPKSRLVMVPTGFRMEEARGIFSKHKIEKLPVIDKNGRLAGLVTAKDLIKKRQFPNATKDSKGRLRVAAAVGVKGDYLERAERLIAAGTDAIVIDIAHGHSQHTVDAIREFKKRFGSIEVIAGNVATGNGTKDLITAGADAIKVGIGPGSICTTRLVAGVGIPQLTAIIECADVADDYGVPIIGDGGIRRPGDVTKAIAAGAASVMVGSLFVGTEESPGPTVLRNGIRYKMTRGMASLTATIDRNVKENGGVGKSVEDVINGSVPEGVEGFIHYKGHVDEVVRQLVGGLRSGMSYCGATKLEELRKNAEFVRITNAGYAESMPHDIEATGT